MVGISHPWARHITIIYSEAQPSEPVGKPGKILKYLWTQKDGFGMVWYIPKNQFNVDSDQINQLNHWIQAQIFPSASAEVLHRHRSKPIWLRGGQQRHRESDSSGVEVFSSSSRVGLSVVLTDLLPWWFVYRHEWLTLTYAMMWPSRNLHDFTLTCLT